ncbi:MAG: hypothetical protein ACR65R_11725 [Methylomicrobium sp.]
MTQEGISPQCASAKRRSPSSSRTIGINLGGRDIVAWTQLRQGFGFKAPGKRHSITVKGKSTTHSIKEVRERIPYQCLKDFNNITVDAWQRK